MTIKEIVIFLKQNELTADEEYIAEVLREEKNLENEIVALLVAWWGTKTNRKQFYSKMDKLITDRIGTISDGIGVKLDERYTQGYLEGCFLAQAIQNEFKKIEKQGKLNLNWHIGGDNYADDMNYYANRLKDSIKKALNRGIVMGSKVETVVSEAKKSFKTLGNSTKALIDTECTYAKRQGSKDAYINYNSKEYRFLATLDRLTCDDCSALDGKTFATKDATVGVNYPPIHKWCRCVTIPVFDDFNDGKRAARDKDGNSIEVSMNYEEWNNKFGNGNMVASSGGGTVKLIKQSDIDSVSLNNIPGLDNKQLSSLQEAHKRVLQVAKDKNNSMEVAVMLDKDMNEIETVFGSTTEIDLNVPGRSNALYVIHNHPNNSSFSDRDLAWFVKNSNTKYFSIVTNSGKVEMLYRPGELDTERFITEYKRLEKKFEKEIAKDLQKGYDKVVSNLLQKTKSGIIYVR